MTEGLQKGEDMALGAVQDKTAAGYSIPAKTNAQESKKDSGSSFMEKLWNGRKETGTTADSQAAHGKGSAANQESLFGKRIAAALAEPDQTAAADTDAGEKIGEILDYQDFFQEKIDEIFVKVLNGETEPSYQIGSQSFTEKDWKNFLKKFDSVQDAIRKLMREEHAKRAAKKLKTSQTYQAREKKTSVTDQGSLLFTDSTSCVYPSADEKKEDARYVTWYTKEGIYCRGMGQTEEEWSLSFKDPKQYDQVMELIGQFPSDWNLRFAAHENFWTDFLNGDIDTERFVEFMKGTNKGVPDYSITKDGSTYIDRDSIQWAKYLNPFGAEFYTAEEFQKKWEMEIAANASKRTKISHPYDDQYHQADDSINTSRQLYCEYPGGPLYTAAEMEKRMWEAYLQAKNRKGIR